MCVACMVRACCVYAAYMPHACCMYAAYMPHVCCMYAAVHTVKIQASARGFLARRAVQRRAGCINDMRRAMDESDERLMFTAVARADLLKIHVFTHAPPSRTPACTHASMHASTHASMHTHQHVRTPACTLACTPAHMQACTPARAYAHARTQVPLMGECKEFLRMRGSWDDEREAQMMASLAKGALSRYGHKLGHALTFA